MEIKLFEEMPLCIYRHDTCIHQKEISKEFCDLCLKGQMITEFENVLGILNDIYDVIK